MRQQVWEGDEEIVELEARILAYACYLELFVKWWRLPTRWRVSREVLALQRRRAARIKELSR